MLKTFKLLLFFLILHLATNAQSLSVDADLRRVLNTDTVTGTFFLIQPIQLLL